MTSRLTAFAGAVLLALTVAGCSSGIPIRPRAGASSISSNTTLTGPAATPGSSYSLDLLDAANVVDVQTADLGSRLFRIVSNPQVSGEPSVRQVSSDAFEVSLAGTGSDDVTIDVARDVTWSLQFSSGISTATVDITGSTLKSLSALAGISTLDITAGSPEGRATIIEAGGLSALALHVPQSTAVSVAALAGAGSISLFGVTHSGIAAGSVIATPAVASNLYAIIAQGGVSSVLVST